MTTNTAGTTARKYHTKQVHYLSLDFTYANAGQTLDMGYLPNGAKVIRAGVIVKTAFNGDTSNILDIGTSADTDGFATDLALGTIGVISADEMATTNDANITADIMAQIVVVSTASASAGEATAWIEYIV